jgi:hypothetical protein
MKSIWLRKLNYIKQTDDTYNALHQHKEDVRLTYIFFFINTSYFWNNFHRTFIKSPG